MTDTRKKHPRDPAQLAKLMIDIASGEVEDREPTPEEQGKDKGAVERGRLGGLKGGHARAEKMTAAERPPTSLGLPVPGDVTMTVGRRHRALAASRWTRQHQHGTDRQPGRQPGRRRKMSQMSQMSQGVHT
jgi:hypothetical protein